MWLMVVIAFEDWWSSADAWVVVARVVDGNTVVAHTSTLFQDEDSVISSVPVRQKKSLHIARTSMRLCDEDSVMYSVPVRK